MLQTLQYHLKHFLQIDKQSIMPLLRIRPSNLDGTLSYRDTFSNAAFAAANTASPIASMNVRTSGTSATWTIPAGVTKVRVTVVGGGGTGSGNAGGGGGGAAVKILTGLTPGNTLTFTVGGTGATSQVASGTQTITTISATGGGNPDGTSGGAGGIGSNGDLNIGGQGGSALDESINTRLWGAGGSSYLGGGGAGVAAASSVNNAGRAYGGGGSGSSGAGAAGVVIFEYQRSI